MHSPKLMQYLVKPERLDTSMAGHVEDENQLIISADIIFADSADRLTEMFQITFFSGIMVLLIFSEHQPETIKFQ